MIRSTLVLAVSLLAAVAGCGSSLTTAGQEVKVAGEPQKEACVEVDSEVKTSTDALEDRLVALRNRAGAVGGNYVFKTSKPENVGGKALYIWRAYRCPA